MLMPLDIETTGLNPRTDHVLEIAWTLLHDTLEPMIWGGDGEPLVITQTIKPLAYKQRTVLEWPQTVVEMHAKSGLIADLAQPDLMSLQGVERLILKDIDRAQEIVDEPVKLLGFSVHFDLSFIEFWMPKLARRLNHRIYDVSTLKQFFSSLDLPVPDGENKHPHRAAADVREALTVARKYRSQMQRLMEDGLG